MDEPFSLMLTPPPLVRALNTVLSPVDRFIDLSSDAMMRRAELETGLHDWGDADALERLEALCRAVESNTELSPLGRFAVATYYHFHCVDRLRMIDLLGKHPEIEDVPVKAPIFIVGWYRTGTTLLHNLLAADARHRAPRTWELLSPAPCSADPRWDKRLRTLRSQVILQLSRYLVPETETAHFTPIDGPEECFFLLENDFVSSTMFNTYMGYDYAEGLLEQDLRPTYHFFRKQLQVLSHRDPERRWVLKCPFHLWHLDALLDAFPDARIVFTHRDVAESLPSNCSLSAMTSSKFHRSTDLEALGSFWQHYYRQGISRATEARARLADGQSIDVPLPLLAKAPMDTLEAIYERFGFDYDDQTRASFQAALRSNPKQTKGKHRYRGAQFGLSTDQLRREFGDYHAFYEELLSRHGFSEPAAVRRAVVAAG
jgi:hypothetical protein